MCSAFEHRDALTDSEKAMLDGRDGKARQKAMELLVRYAEALGAERFVDTNNVAGVPGSANPVPAELLQADYAGSEYDAIFSYFDLDSDELVDVAARARAHLPPSGRRRSRTLGDARRQARGLQDLPGPGGVCGQSRRARS